MKRVFALLILIILAAGAGVGYLIYRAGFQSVALTVDNGETVAIHKGAYEGDGHTAAKLGETINSTTGPTTIKLKKGEYTAVLDDKQHRYSDTIFGLHVGDAPVTLTIRPAFTAEALKIQLATEEPAIGGVLKAKYPQIGHGFSIASGSLYERGDWYAALLKPTDPNTDTYRVVLQKKDGVWVVITDPPQIVVSRLRYPATPASVVSDVDNFKH